MTVLPCICLLTAPSARDLTWLTAASPKLQPFVCLISRPACACGSHPAMTSWAGFHGGAMVLLLLQMLLLLLPVYAPLRRAGWASAVAHAAPRGIKALYPDIRRGNRDGWTCFCVGGWRRQRPGLLFVLVLFFHLVWFAWNKWSCKVTRKQTTRRRCQWPSARVNCTGFVGLVNVIIEKSDEGNAIFFQSVKSPLTSMEMHSCHPKKKQKKNWAQYHMKTRKRKMWKNFRL